MRYLKPFAPLITWTLLVFLLPPLAAWLGGVPLSEYLHFPLVERSWDALPPRSDAYWSASALAVVFTALLVWLGFGGSPPRELPELPHDTRRVPPWWWLGAAGLAAGLIAAATGLPDPGLLLAGSGLLLAVNADAVRRGGHCLMTERPAFFVLLFPAGALLGWSMHYVNLFLQNWTYPDLAETATWQIILLLSLEYALLLPLLLSLRQWLASFPGLLRRLTHGRPLPGRDSHELGWLLAGIGAIGLAGAGIWPDRIYPLSWTAPLLLALGLSLIAGRQGLFAGARHGDWSRLLLTVLAGLLLGLGDLAWASGFGPGRDYALSLLQGGPSLLGLALPAWLQFAGLALLALWFGDQLMAPWRTRPKKRFPDFPVKITIG